MIGFIEEIGGFLFLFFSCMAGEFLGIKMGRGYNHGVRSSDFKLYEI